MAEIQEAPIVHGRISVSSLTVSTEMQFSDGSKITAIENTLNTTSTNPITNGAVTTHLNNTIATKQDTLTQEQLTNIAAVPGKQDQLSQAQLDNIAGPAYSDHHSIATEMSGQSVGNHALVLQKNASHYYEHNLSFGSKPTSGTENRYAQIGSFAETQVLLEAHDANVSGDPGQPVQVRVFKDDGSIGGSVDGTSHIALIAPNVQIYGGAYGHANDGQYGTAGKVGGVHQIDFHDSGYGNPANVRLQNTNDDDVLHCYNQTSVGSAQYAALKANRLLFESSIALTMDNTQLQLTNTQPNATTSLATMQVNSIQFEDDSAMYAQGYKPPEMRMLGKAKEYVVVGDTYVDQGVQLWDNGVLIGMFAEGSQNNEVERIGRLIDESSPSNDSPPYSFALSTTVNTSSIARYLFEYYPKVTSSTASNPRNYTNSDMPSIYRLVHVVANTAPSIVITAAPSQQTLDDPNDNPDLGALPYFTISTNNPFGYYEYGATMYDAGQIIGTMQPGGATTGRTITRQFYHKPSNTFYNSLQLTVLGEWHVRYTGQDAQGLYAPIATRRVDVTDTDFVSNPIVAVTGDDPLEVPQNSNYQELGATLYDGGSPQTTGGITVTYFSDAALTTSISSLDLTAAVGTNYYAKYTWTETTTRADPRTASATRTITIIGALGPQYYIVALSGGYNGNDGPALMSLSAPTADWVDANGRTRWAFMNDPYTPNHDGTNYWWYVGTIDMLHLGGQRFVALNVQGHTLYRDTVVTTATRMSQGWHDTYLGHANDTHEAAAAYGAPVWTVSSAPASLGTTWGHLAHNPNPPLNSYIVDLDFATHGSYNNAVVTTSSNLPSGEGYYSLQFTYQAGANRALPAMLVAWRNGASPTPLGSQGMVKAQIDPVGASGHGLTIGHYNNDMHFYNINVDLLDGQPHTILFVKPAASVTDTCYMCASGCSATTYCAAITLYIDGVEQPAGQHWSGALTVGSPMNVGITNQLYIGDNYAFEGQRAERSMNSGDSIRDVKISDHAINPTYGRVLKPVPDNYAGNLQYSDDGGVTFNTSPYGPTHMRAVKYANGVYVGNTRSANTASNPNQHWYSTDGLNWTQAAGTSAGNGSGGPSQTAYDQCFYEWLPNSNPAGTSHGVWVCFQKHIGGNSSENDYSYSWDNGQTWSYAPKFSVDNWAGLVTEVRTLNGQSISRFWAKSYNSQYPFYSTDGQTWTQAASVGSINHILHYARGTYYLTPHSFSNKIKSWQGDLATASSTNFVDDPTPLNSSTQQHFNFCGQLKEIPHV